MAMGNDATVLPASASFNDFWKGSCSPCCASAGALPAAASPRGMSAGFAIRLLDEVTMLTP